MTKEEFYKILEELYEQAFCLNRLDIAFRTRQLQASLMGLLPSKSKTPPKLLSDLTDAEIDDFLKQYEGTC